MRLGRGASYIAQIESGARWKRSLPPIDALAEIAAALNVPVEELLPPALRQEYAVARAAAAARPAQRSRPAVAPPRRLLEYQSALEDAMHQREFLERALLESLRAVGHRALPLLNAQAARDAGYRVGETLPISTALFATTRQPAVVMGLDGHAPWLLDAGDLLLIDRIAPHEWRRRPGQFVVIRDAGAFSVRTVAMHDGRVTLNAADPVVTPIEWRAGTVELTGVVIGIVRMLAGSLPGEHPWHGPTDVPPLSAMPVDPTPARPSFAEPLLLEIVNPTTLFALDPPGERERVMLPLTATPIGEVFYDRRTASARYRPLMLVPAYRVRGINAPALFCVATDDLRGLGIAVGDLLIIDTDRGWPRAGELIAAAYNGRDVTRLVAIAGGDITLLARPEPGAQDDDHAPITVADPQSLRIFGTVVDVLTRPQGGWYGKDRGGLSTEASRRDQKRD